MTNGDRVRLTHIIRPAVINPRPLPTGPLVTPENSDLSDLSAPSSSDLSGSGTETEFESDSDTATEMGDSISDTNGETSNLHDHPHGDDTYAKQVEEEEEEEGYQVPPPPPIRQVDSTLGMRSPTLESAMDELRVSELSLSRTYSNSSSQYASSEGTTGSDFGMADSLTLPSLPTSVNGGPASGSGAGIGAGSGDGGWVSTFDSGPVSLGAPPLPSSVLPRKVAPVGGVGRKGWQDKPTFFEYLYGA